MNKLIWITIIILIFSLPAYALRDPQIPDGSMFTYSEFIKVTDDSLLKALDQEPEGRVTKKHLDQEMIYTYKVNSYTQDNAKYYKINIASTSVPGLNEIGHSKFELIVKDDLSPVHLYYHDISQATGLEIQGDMRWDYSKKILHYYAKTVYGKNQDIKYDVNLKYGQLYGEAISEFPLGLLYAAGFPDNNEKALKTLAPYTQVFGMPVVDFNIAVAKESEELVTPAGKFRCHKVTAIPNPPEVYKPFLFLLGVLGRFGDMFSQTYWVTDTAPYITVKYHITIMSVFQRDGVLQKADYGSKADTITLK